MSNPATSAETIERLAQHGRKRLAAGASLEAFHKELLVMGVGASVARAVVEAIDPAEASKVLAFHRVEQQHVAVVVKRMEKKWADHRRKCLVAGTIFLVFGLLASSSGGVIYIGAIVGGAMLLGTGIVMTMQS